MKPYFSFLLVFAFLGLSSQEIKDKETFKKCRKEFNKKTCLSDDDGDGVLSYLDVCKDVAGPPENNGCPFPNTDGDDVLDKDDVCPLVAGPPENNGCPWQDTDGDGIIDKDDKCPTVVGIIEKEGCPGKDCKKFYEEEQERLRKFQDESKGVNYNELKDIIVGAIDFKLLKEKEIIIFTRTIETTCGYNWDSYCHHRYNYECPVFSSEDLWTNETALKIYNKTNKNLIFGIRYFGFGNSVDFFSDKDLKRKSKIIKVVYRDKEEPAKIFYKNEFKKSVISQYSILGLNVIENEFNNKVKVQFNYLDYPENKNTFKVYLKTYQYINNHWKLIETKNEN